MNNSSCTKCGAQFSAIRLATQWPTKIRCKSCGANHRYRFGVLIAIPYTALLLLSFFYLSALSEKFVTIEDGIYTTSPLQLIVKFGGLAISYIIISLALGLTLKSTMDLKGKENS